MDFQINGRALTIDVDPRTSLLDLLRDLGCAVSIFGSASRRARRTPRYSILTLPCRFDPTHCRRYRNVYYRKITSFVSAGDRWRLGFYPAESVPLNHSSIPSRLMS